MPPQRRKIVPPTTTSKVRRKVAGTGKPVPADSDSTRLEGSETADKAATDKIATDKPVADRTATDKPVADKTATDKPSLAKTGAGKAVTGKTVTAKTVTGKSVAAETVPAESSLAEPATAESSATPSAGARSGIGYKHVMIVAVIAVVLGAFAAVAAFKPFATIDNAAWVDSAATQEVTSATTDALQTLYTYKAETIDADFDAARAVLNQSMLDEFNSTAETTKSAVVQTNTGTEASVTDIGVTRLEDDKAELLANVNISATQNGSATGSAEGPLTVNMEKIDGTWKLSAIDDQ
ncbi:hypothetical protein [Rhodococcus sp. 06-235-1A]|uniref:hypothetical protein n=1 Tax=Rhodococcus sp. 06-235-1A TaxID=2022508 RepID=UPI0015C6822A|nr:hypothetical protein [Rhodococcus sp. 06-235-1A]